MYMYVHCTSVSPVRVTLCPLCLSPSLPLSPADDLMQVLGRLENSTDVDGSCRLARHLLDILEAADYRTMQVV